MWLNSKESSCNAGEWVQPLGQEASLKKDRQPTPVFLPGKIPWTEEPGGLQSMGLKESDMTEQLNKKTRTWRNRQLKSESCSVVFDSW